MSNRRPRARMDRSIDRWIGRRTSGYMHVHRYVCIYIYIYIHIYIYIYEHICMYVYIYIYIIQMTTRDIVQRVILHDNAT